VTTGRDAHSLHKFDTLLDGKNLCIVVMGHAGKVRVDELGPPAVQDRTVARHGHQRSPAGMVRHSDNCTVSRHGSSLQHSGV
jgi:hypothetical protein